MSAAPLAGVSVVVTRPRDQSAEFAARLAARGAEVIVCPVIETRAITSGPAIDEALRGLDRTDVLVVTSVNGAAALADRLAERDRAIPGGVTVVAVGAATAGALIERGHRVDVVPPVATGAGIVDALRSRVAGRRVLLARARLGRPELPAGLAAAGAEVIDVAFYETRPRAPSEAEVRLALAGDVWTFTSPSTVEGAVSAVGARHLTGRSIVVIGPTTADAVRRYGLGIAAEATAQTVEALTDAVVAASSS